MLLLVWPIQQHLTHTTAFLIYSLRAHITPKKENIERPIIAIPQIHAPTSVLVKVFIAVKRHHDSGKSNKGHHLNWATHKLQRCNYYHCGKCGCVQADMVPQKFLRVLHLVSNRKSAETLGGILNTFVEGAASCVPARHLASLSQNNYTETVFF